MALVVASWAAIYLAASVLPDRLAPWVWLGALIATPAATVASAIAGRLHSKWWYSLTAVACLSVIMLVADLAT